MRVMKCNETGKKYVMKRIAIFNNVTLLSWLNQGREGRDVEHARRK
jgi:hypothetical protein